MDQEEQSKLARELQKEFYPGRKVWKRGTGEPVNVKYAHVRENGDPIVIMYDTEFPIRHNPSEYTLTPPDAPGTYIVDRCDGGVMLYRFGGERWWRVDADGAVLMTTNPPTCRKVQISTDIEGAIFPEVE